MAVRLAVPLQPVLDNLCSSWTTSTHGTTLHLTTFTWAQLNTVLKVFVAERLRRWRLANDIFIAKDQLPGAMAEAGLASLRRTSLSVARGMQRVGIIVAHMTLEICRAADLPPNLDGCMDLSNPQLSQQSGRFPWATLLLPIPAFISDGMRMHREAIAIFREELNTIFPAEILDRICCYVQLHDSVPHRTVVARLFDELGARPVPIGVWNNKA